MFLGIGQQAGGQLQGGHQRPGVRGGGDGRDSQQRNGLTSGSHGIVKAIQACQGAGAQPVGVAEIGQHCLAVRREISPCSQDADGSIGGAEGLLGPTGLVEQHVGQATGGDGYIGLEVQGSGCAAFKGSQCLLVCRDGFLGPAEDAETAAQIQQGPGVQGQAVQRV
ncbi:hypothetical protein ACGFWD_27350 [Streptomyces sp. NPDC048448]|uniref:hypothetical protein n=1 Tax=Streptomyces sp. NPDC048448 TaxID=3365554 RepID=UPI0037108BC8